jgi:hypothetical protein
MTPELKAAIGAVIVCAIILAASAALRRWRKARRHAAH